MPMPFKEYVLATAELSHLDLSNVSDDMLQHHYRKDNAFEMSRTLNKEIVREQTRRRLLKKLEAKKKA